MLMIGKDGAVAGQVEVRAMRALVFGGSGQIGRAVAMEQALHAAMTPVSICGPRGCMALVQDIHASGGSSNARWIGVLLSLWWPGEHRCVTPAR